MAKPLPSLRLVLVTGLLLAVVCSTLSAATAAPAPAPAPLPAIGLASGDNGDGTFTNPIVFADAPDPDVIRVGEDYYMVHTSMEYFPGCPIAHSRDLVNWKIVGYAMPRSDAAPAFDMRGATAYTDGPWATSIRHHKGKFYVLTTFNGIYNWKWSKANPHTSFMCIADRPEGPWEVIDLKTFLYDPGLFFDDDGRVYVACGQWKISLYELAPDARSVIAGPTPLWDAKQEGSKAVIEGSRVYKVDGYYYIINVANDPMEVRRSRSITGPYERRSVMKKWIPQRSLVKQGALVQTSSGEWWSLLFEGAGGLGRVLWLQPLQWRDGWPVMGPTGDGYGVVTSPKPAGHPVTRGDTGVGDDTFSGPALNPEWQWNHNPDDAHWSLTARPGHLRLTTSQQVRDRLDLEHARNTLVQRIRGDGCTATIALDVAGLKDGDVAGLAALIIPGYTYLSVERAEGRNRLVLAHCPDKNTPPSIVVNGPELTSPTLWLRCESLPGGVDLVRFSYSLDRRIWQRLGDAFPFKYRSWKGNAFGLFALSTRETGGHADFDEFDFFQPELTGNRRQAFRPLEAARCDTRSDPNNPRTRLSKNADRILSLANQPAGSWIKFNSINFGGGATRVHLRALNPGPTPRRVEVSLEGPEGPVLATVSIPPGNGPEDWRETTADLAAPSPAGVHPLFIRFVDEGLSLHLVRFDPVASYSATLRRTDTPRSDRAAKIKVLDAGDGLVALQTSKGRFYSADPVTGAVTVNARDVGPSEKFLITDLGPDRIALSTALNHAYLVYDENGDLRSEPIPAPGRAAAWSLTPATLQTTSLKDR